MSTPKPASLPHLLIFRDGPAEAYAAMTPEQRQDLTRRWTAWIDGLMAAGKMVSGHPLELGGCVISGKRGEVTTDGPYAEAKEAVAGYFFLTVENFAEAQAIARQCPSLSLGLTVEVRAIAPVSPVLKDLHARPGPGER